MTVLPSGLDEAQALLKNLQAESRARRLVEGLPTMANLRPVESPRQRHSLAEEGQRFLEARRRQAGVTSSLWGKAAAVANGLEWELAREAQESETAADSGPGSCVQSISSDGVRLYPSMGLQALQRGQATLMRVWLFARYLDTAGSGWCEVQELREVTTGEASELRCFSWRRLRQILNEGEGVYWARETGKDGEERLRYTSARDLALALEVEHLAGDPVLLSAETLAANIGDFKAHLYAGFHASRQGEEESGAPIGRDTLTQLAGVSARTLRRYETRAEVDKHRNYEIGGRYSQEAMQEEAWEHGTAVFEFVDHRGHQGKRGGVYIAHALPNSYSVDLQTAPRGRQRKINKALSHARNLGVRANSWHRIFHETAAGAAKAAGKDSGRPAFWQAGTARSGAGLWHCLAPAGQL